MVVASSKLYEGYGGHWTLSVPNAGTTGRQPRFSPPHCIRDIINPIGPRRSTPFGGEVRANGYPDQPILAIRISISPSEGTMM